MNLKNVLNKVDYKGLALQHCEKAVIVLITALLVMFLISGIRTAMSASSVSPEEIDKLAAALDRSVKTSEWNEAVAEREQVKNPPFEAQIAKLMAGILPNQFTLAQPFFKFVDFGGILRQKPEILAPYHALARTDKGAVSLYKIDPRTGEFIEEEIIVRAAPKPKPADDDKDTKKKAPVAKKAGPKGSMRTAMLGGGGDETGGGGGGGGMMDQYTGGQRGMSGMRSQMAGGAIPGAGARAGGADDELSGNLGASKNKTTASSIRRAAQKSDEEIFDSIEEQEKATTPDPAEKDKGDPKGPVKRKLKQEEVRGIRWAMITALLRHREQVKKYVEALHTADDPPNYRMVKVERREVLSDGSLSEWGPVDVKRLDDLVKRLPGRWMPEDSAVRAAKADFSGLMMRLPQLEVGAWERYVRQEAHDAARAVSGNANLAARGQGDEAAGEEPDADDLNRGLFRGGGGGVPSGMGARMGGGMMPGGMGGGGMAGGGMGGYGQMGGAMAGDRKRGAEPTQPAKKSLTPGQPPVQRSNAEIVQIRFVDYTVEPEHTYQYRLKVVVKNPNHNRLDVINPEVAVDEELSSEEWSEPTPLVHIPPDVEYYVLDRVRIREEAKLQVHVWPPETGDWQCWDFTIKPGDPIGTKHREYPMVGWEDPPKIKKQEFDFSTQDLLLDVTGGDKPFTFEVDGSQIQFTERLPTEVFVVDRLGDLAVRNDDFDKHNADRVEREKYIKEVREKARTSDDRDSKDPKKAGAKVEAGTREDFEGRSAPSRRDASDK